MTVDDLVKRLLALNKPDSPIYINEGLEGYDEHVIDLTFFPAEDDTDERVVIW
jgi:hypothetical protein